MPPARPKRAALPQDGVHRFIGPLALAWTRMAAGDLPGADAALQQLDKFNGFEPLKDFQLALLYDFAGKADKAESYYDKTLAGNDAAQLAADRRHRQFLRAPRQGRQGKGALPEIHRSERRQRDRADGAGGARRRVR